MGDLMSMQCGRALGDIFAGIGCFAGCSSSTASAGSDSEAPKSASTASPEQEPKQEQTTSVPVQEKSVGGTRGCGAYI